MVILLLPGLSWMRGYGQAVSHMSRGGDITDEQGGRERAGRSGAFWLSFDAFEFGFTAVAPKPCVCDVRQIRTRDAPPSCVCMCLLPTVMMRMHVPVVPRYPSFRNCSFRLFFFLFAFGVVFVVARPKQSHACPPSAPSVGLLALSGFVSQLLGAHQSLHGAVQSISVVASELGVGTLERRVSGGLGLLDTVFLAPDNVSIIIHLSSPSLGCSSGSLGLGVGSSGGQGGRRVRGGFERTYPLR